MTGPALQNRCWNHEDREASCRCPRCGRSYCRECVTEHQSRFLCAACLAAIGRERQARRTSLRRFVPAAMILGGLVLGWVVFYTAGEAMLESSAHLEQTSWQNR